MFFKNLRVYRFNRPIPWSADELRAALEQRPFKPCSAGEPFSLGWTASATAIDSADPVYTEGDCVLICLKRQERILPASVVKEAVEERAAEIELKEQRKVSKKERKDLKDVLTEELLPRAFTRSRQTFGYVDYLNGLLWVDTASNTRADEFTATLRETVGTLPVQFVELKQAPASQFTQWVSEGSTPSPFLMGGQCELKAGDGSDTTIRCKGSESLHDAVSHHVESGMSVTEIALSWDERLTFTVNDALHIKRVKLSDQLSESPDLQGEDAADRFAGSFALMTLEFRQLFGALVETLGGEDTTNIDQAVAA